MHITILQTSQSTLLLRKRKEMREVDVSLDLMKKDYKSRMDECEDRRVLFEVKQAKMREQVLKFEKFIQENDAKRIRAEAKAKNERQLFAEKCKEMGTLKSKIEELDKLRDILVTELGELFYMPCLLLAGDAHRQTLFTLIFLIAIKINSN